MRRDDNATVIGRLLSDDDRVSFGELCRVCGASAETILDMIDHGILEQQHGAPSQWRFSATSLYRVRTVVRLRRDLGVNFAGAALTLELLDELAALRARVRRLERFEEF